LLIFFCTWLVREPGKIAFKTMAEEPQFPLPEDSVHKRRAKPADLDAREIKFARRQLEPERLQALRDFLKRASADEIASVRKLYGDMPEVLEIIGLEILPRMQDKEELA